MTVITVSQLNRYVKSLIESDAHLGSVMLSGEISNFVNHYKSGHLYLSLKDENALVKAVMFRTYAERLRFQPENGMKVIVRARVSLYEKDGAFQIYIEDMQPDGAGALQIAFEQLKARLASEGLFEESRKQPIPRYPRRIAVITSPTGAAVRDILNVLSRRYPLAEVLLLPVLVQGENAPSQLKQALRYCDDLKQNHNPQTPDVIIMGRGGGSLEELWAFNDEGLARAIVNCSIPIISGVGHETDFTICDFVADLRAPTPSAAAELAVPEREELRRYIQQLNNASSQAMASFLRQASQRVNTVAQKRCLATPLFYVNERAMRLDYIVRAFSTAAGLAISRADRRLSATAGKLDALSPLRVLSRGYALASKQNTVIHSAEQVAIGDTLSLQLSDGKVVCRVTETERSNTNT